MISDKSGFFKSYYGTDWFFSKPITLSIVDRIALVVVSNMMSPLIFIV